MKTGMDDELFSPAGAAPGMVTADDAEGRFKFGG